MVGKAGEVHKVIVSGDGTRTEAPHKIFIKKDGGAIDPLSTYRAAGWPDQ